MQFDASGMLRGLGKMLPDAWFLGESGSLQRTDPAKFDVRSVKFSSCAVRRSLVVT
jgi:hypothetical protein